MITIRVKGYDQKDKLVIAKYYLLPEVYKQYSFNKDQVVFSDDILAKIIQRVPEEEGVRNLKRGIEAIASWINVQRYITTSEPIRFPLHIAEQHVNEYINPREQSTYIHTMYM